MHIIQTYHNMNHTVASEKPNLSHCEVAGNTQPYCDPTRKKVMNCCPKSTLLVFYQPINPKSHSGLIVVVNICKPQSSADPLRPLKPPQECEDRGLGTKGLDFIRQKWLKLREMTYS